MLTTTSTVMCPHGGMAQLVTSNTDALDRRRAGAAADRRAPDRRLHVHAGRRPSPCVTIRWVSAATQTKVRNVPVLLQTSVGLCLNAAQAPQGTAIVVQMQTAGARES